MLRYWRTVPCEVKAHYDKDVDEQSSKKHEDECGYSMSHNMWLFSVTQFQDTIQRLPIHIEKHVNDNEYYFCLLHFHIKPGGNLKYCVAIITFCSFEVNIVAFALWVPWSVLILLFTFSMLESFLLVMNMLCTIVISTVRWYFQVNHIALLRYTKNKNHSSMVFSCYSHCIDWLYKQQNPHISGFWHSYL